MTERYNSYFPSQKIATSGKTKDWFRKCIDAAISTANGTSNGSGQRTYYQKKLLRDLENGIVDPSDIETTTNYVPIAFGTKTLDKIQNYPLAKPRIDLLVGESIKRRFDWMVKVINDDAISEKEKELKQYVTKSIYELAVTDNLTEEMIQKKLSELTKWEYYEYQDMRERMSSQILQYLWREQELPIKFMEGMSNALNIGEECYCVDTVGDDLKFRVVDPLSLSFIRNSSSYRLEDSDTIVEDRYLPIGHVIDLFYDYLTSTDISKLERGTGTGSTGDNGITNTYPAFSSDMFADASSNADLISFFDSNAIGSPTGPYDSNGNVRVSRVVWKGMRRVGIKSFLDENGISQKDYVDENYTANTQLGEKVKWVWISEWYEGTRIADDIYVKMMPRPIQFRRMDNISASSSGYVGTIYPQSLLEMVKPYQYFYVLVMEELKKAIRKFKAPQIEIDLAKIPDNWTLENWMYYAEEMGYLVVDSFKEGDKGLATGKLAGQYNTTGKVYNPDMGNYIQQLQIILSYIERQVAIMSGVSDQRLGQIENRETVGGVERSVAQSSNITEKIFAMHDNTRLRAMELLLETAKYVWRNKSVKKVQYVLDDMSSFILNVDTDLFNEADYGIFVNNASDDTQLISSMKQLAHAMIQNDKINVKDLMTILTSPSISSMRRELERSEGERQKEQSKQFDVENQRNNAEVQAKIEQADKLIELDREKNIRDNETKLAIAMMANDSSDITESDNTESSLERDAFELKKEEVDNKARLEAEKLNETKRHNIAAESIGRLKKASTNTK